jgi:hypothetical protein
MWRLVAAAVLAALVGRPGHAAPAADIVVAWSATPLGAIGEAVADAAARAGAAYTDASPAAVPMPDPRPLIKRGIAAYGSLELDAALTALDAAATLVDQTGAADLDSATLGDLFVYRALTHTQRGDDSRAWDDLLIAAGVDPVRVLDPAAFPPRAVERFAQARAQVGATPRGQLRLVGPTGCQVAIDGTRVTTAHTDLVFGRHWLDARCEGRAPVRRRLVVDRAALDVAIAGAELEPPADDELRVQARAAAARALVTVVAAGRTMVVRRIAITGAEQERVTLALRGSASADARAVAAVVGRLLAPPVRARAPWHRSRWAWAAVGAAAASAVLVPLALRGGAAPSVSVRPTGVPESWQ